ncbi:peptidase dimerization domain-containing protein [Streptomyces sp. NPDC006668]|uniref:peptidase dimerization domain-containing protein n=1 Tax=Streptomyces sp. NPDC006668 TaxID=3156903 RepID=UPI0033C26CBF
MVHPAPVDIAEARPFAVSHSKISFVGRSAHAAAYPEAGINAADAFTVAQVAIELLRQQLPASARVHGVVTHAGDAPNAIPERSTGRWYVRAETLAELARLEPRVMRAFQAGALATGCDLQIEPESKPYAEFRTDETALGHYRLNALALGRESSAPCPPPTTSASSPRTAWAGRRSEPCSTERSRWPGPAWIAALRPPRDDDWHTRQSPIGQGVGRTRHPGWPTSSASHSRRHGGFGTMCWPRPTAWVAEVVATPDPERRCADQAAAGPASKGV